MPPVSKLGFTLNRTIWPRHAISQLTDTKASYDTVAASYAEMFHDGLARHP